MMRPALACLTATLIAAAGAPAFAQTAPDASAMPQAAPAPGATPAAPPAASPAMPAPGAPMAAPAQPGPPPVPGSPANPTGAPPAIPGAPTAAAGEAAPPPIVPTTESRFATQFLQSVCLPLLHHGDIKQVTKAAGFKQSRGIWTFKMDAGKTVVLYPPSPRNPSVCRLDVAFDVDNWLPIVDAVNNWAYAHQPQLQLNYQAYRTVAGTTTWAWQANNADGTMLGLAFNITKNANGSPMGGKFDIGDLVVTDTTR